MLAEIVTIGDELTRGEIVDTNSAYLAGQLWDRDITVRWMTSCRDDVDDMRAALTAATARADLVICSGGLGPTEDDLTVDVLAGLVGVEPVIDEVARDRMAARFALGGIAVTPIQLRQVRVPSGSRVHINNGGLAPCFEVALGGVPVICLPGVPREIFAIMDGGLGARLGELRLARGNAPAIARRIYRVFGRGESQISQACRGLIDDITGASIHYQVKFPETLVKIVVKDADRAIADERLATIDVGLRARLGEHLYGTGEDALPQVAARRFAAAGVTLATAESCTGGLLGSLITAVAGSSRYYRGGAIVYANEEKVRQLGIDPELLTAFGAVSEETARAMASCARERFGVDLAVAITGIAGPDGGTPDKPVGTVWLAVASADGVTSKRINFPGARDMVRTLAAWWGLRMLMDGVPGGA
ncbi:MAG: CinA family nicotinamide mononucleotide deamidase-related protein [Deltaproteobacteria bacterium]|nr:CinA family nicotinamide mononucleotide deamidase-related protein [Deltaproteobacteria bacterium]